MFEAIYVPVQTVNNGSDILLQNSIRCPKGRVLLREGSGVLTLKGPSPCNSCNRFSRYQVTLNGNMAVPTTGTAGPIEVTLVINGGDVQSSKAIVTPAAVDEYFNFTVTAVIDVPNGCCANVTFRNTSDADAAINTQNVNVVVDQRA